ncbi:MAG: glycosyltransferase family 2 protein [Acidobacteriota bacterium]
MVSIIIVNYNGVSFLEKLLNSIKKQTYKDFEIIFIDNNSSDHSLRIVENLKNSFSIKIIKNKQNLGFAKACNQGIKESKGEYILILNFDVYLESNFLEMALNGFRKDKKIGMVSGKILRFDKATIDSTGQFLSITRKVIERGYGKKDIGKFEKEGFVFSSCGACAFYKKEMLDQIKIDEEYFDEDFFSFWEDIDLGWRANLFGWKGYYVPEAVAYHFRGGTQKRKTILGNFFRIASREKPIIFHVVKNHYLTLIKNEKLKDFVLYLPFIMGFDILLFLYLLFFSPSIFAMIYKNRKIFKRAIEKRKKIKNKLKEIQ